MIENNEKTSLLIKSQLPEFVRDNPDYTNFVTFVQAYYEWLEQTGNVTDRAKNILNYADIDRTTEEFLDHFVQQFIPYYPDNTTQIDKKTAVKIAKQFYGTKGTPASYQLLFRVLYDSDFDIFYTKDVVLKASDGQWYVAKSLKLASDDDNFLNISNYRLFGETTKSIATVENSIKSGTKIEVFISNIQRLFQSGEFVRVVDSNNQDVLFNGQPLRAKIVGQVSQIKIDPNNRGLLYETGDPVVVYGGLNSNTGIGAVATVNETTKGSIQRINVVNGGYGYTFYPNTTIDIQNATGATATVATLNPDDKLSANVNLAPIDTISLKRFTKIGNTNYFFSNVAVSNANTSLINALSFLSFSTYPISSVAVDNGGGGIEKTPIIGAISAFPSDIETSATLYSLGILAPIQIADGGLGYQVNDTIRFTGGTGYGARANVTSVAANGQILNIEYVNSEGFCAGGMGYRTDALPTTTVVSSNVLAANASVYVPGVLGAGAEFSVVVDRVGSITSIKLSENGEDYIETPNISLKVQDILVSNVAIIELPKKGDIVYQGTDIANTSYIATVDSITLLSPFADPKDSIYTFRVFNYNAKPAPNLQLKIDGKNINMNVANVQIDSSFDINGIKNYGDGTARATATFLNGLVVSQGQYLSSRGQPSSYSILQSKNYNNYTYQITVEKAINEYRDLLLNLVHPTGMKMLGKYALKSNSKFDSTITEAVYQGQPLAYYTGYPASGITMSTNSNTNISVVGPANYMTHSDDFSVWTKSRSTVSTNATTAPDGTLTADKMVEMLDVTANSHTVLYTTSANAIASTPFTTSIYLKPAERGNVYVQLFGAAGYAYTSSYTCYFDCKNGRVDIGSTFDSVNMTPQANGWYRVSLTKKTDATGPVRVRVATTVSLGSSVSYIGDGTSGVYLWGVQCEPGTSNTSYVATNTTPIIPQSVMLSPATKSNNIITFTNLAGANIGNIVFAGTGTANSIIESIGSRVNIKSEIIRVDWASNTAVLKENTWLTFANVAYVKANSGSNTINIRSLTNSYNIINNGQYSNTMYPLMDIVLTGDTVYLANNGPQTVTGVDYINGIISVTNNLTANANSLLTINRTLDTSDVIIFGPIGQTYVPELTDELGNTLTTEDNRTIILG